MDEDFRLSITGFPWELLDQIGQGITLVEVKESGNCIVQFVNTAYADMIGYSPQDLIGRPSAYLLKFSPDSQAIETLMAAIKSGERTNTIMQIISRQGKKHWVNTTAFPLREKGGDRDYVAFVHDDVSSYLDNQTTILKRCQILENRNRELESLSVHDPLTGLHNRRFFDSEFTRLTGYHGRRAAPMAVGFIDVDHFKAYNDYYGHQQGDKTLKKIASMIMKHFARVEDLCVRFGGEEFVVVTGDEVSSQQVFRYFDKFRRAVEKLAIPHLKSSTGSVVTVSIGVFHGAPPQDMDEQYILRRADGAMYKAKKRGRNRTVLATGNRFLDSAVAEYQIFEETHSQQAAAMHDGSRTANRTS